MPAPPQDQTEVRVFLLPDLGEGLEEAEVVTWHVAVGDSVELNQTLAEVNTAKALVEVPSPWEGVVEELHAAEGEVVRVGRPLVSIRTEGAPAGSPKRHAVLVGYGVAAEDEPAARRPTSRSRRGRREGPAGQEENGPVPASPPVRRLARELGVDLRGVEGSGPGGRVTREDVLRAGGREAAAGGRQEQGPGTEEPEPPLASRTPAGAERPTGQAGGDVEIVPVRGTRRMIAEKMARSVREIPHVTTFLTVDATSIQAFRRDIEAMSGERVSPLPIVVAGLCEICRRFPTLNSTFDAAGSRIVVYRSCHVGIATDTDRGLVVTVVRDADRKGIRDIAREVARLAEAARKGTARPEELSGSTITVSNVGTFGSEFGTPIINHPEAAVLALGAVTDRALVVQGRVVARPAVTLSLSFDHRVLDGAEAGRAMAALGALLESPFRLGALPR